MRKKNPGDPLPAGFESAEVAETKWLEARLQKADAATTTYCPARVVGADWPAYMLIGRDETEMENNPDYEKTQIESLIQHLSAAATGTTRAAFWEGFSGFTDGNCGAVFLGTPAVNVEGNSEGDSEGCSKWSRLINRFWKFLFSTPNFLRKIVWWFYLKTHRELRAVCEDYANSGMLPLEVREAPRWDYHDGYRRYVLLQVKGPDSVARFLHWVAETAGSGHFPQMCWPEAKSWCLGWEIDDDQFWVFGGPTALVEKMCADKVLVARRIGEYEETPHERH